ncbi:MAG: hypothetical protein KDD04_09220, partial [Sinomicrobium sp.]|nr:hypothetical protein [Sinomicrobium sp.]
MKAGEKTGDPISLDQRDMDFHEAAVKGALEDKKAVPREVLAHYTWLVEKKPKAHDTEQAETDFDTDKLRKFASFISEYQMIDGHGYNGELKATYERLGEAALEQLADYMGLTAYQVAFDKQRSGGSGALSLKGMFTKEKGIYISLKKDGNNDGVIYHSITHRNNYEKMGAYHRFRESEFATPHTIREKVYRLLGIEKEEGDTYPTLVRFDYFERVLSHLHQMYGDREQPTQKQIGQLTGKLGVPNVGVMWEAAELSWLLWYKKIYNKPLPFEERLKKMIRFWDTLQPTHAHRDSQVLYSQYATPCPIGAMIAQYTQMDKAESIFDPSAGNGLLLLGADPRKTHANEIDPIKTASLRFQGFAKITDNNAAEPFDNSMTKAYDVVVTNPPFGRWEAAAAEKERIIKKYFDNRI